VTAGVGSSGGEDGNQRAPLAERTRQFLEKAKEKTIEGVKARMGKDSLIYEAISSSNARSTMAANLLGKYKIPAPKTTGFLDLADGRVMSGGLQLDMANKRVVCTSFNADWTCFRCPAHSEPALKMRGAADSSGHRQAIILADQSFPACLPVAGQEGCLKIILVENGSIKSLFEELVKQVGNRRIPKGSIVLAFSAAHLINVGLAQYAADLVEMGEEVKNKFGGETLFQPLPPIILDGIRDEQLVRAIMELIMWSDDFYSGDNYLETTSLMARCIVLELGEGEQPELPVTRYALPANDAMKGKRVWASGGQDSRALPCIVKPLPISMEKKYAAGITAELRGKLGLDLDKEPLVDRSMGTQNRPKRKVDTLLVGCNSTASKLASALRAKGKTVDVLASSWLTVSRTSMEQLAGQVRKIIQDEDPDLVILQVLDNSCFYAKQEDGSRQLPKMGPDDICHIEGEVQVATRETQLEHFYTIRPLLDAVGKKKTLLVAPLPRYITSGCCVDRRHTINRLDPYYRENMNMQLETLKRNLKDHVFNLNKRNIKVMDPMLDLRGLDPTEVWGPNPIIPLDEAASKLVDGLMLMASHLEGNSHANMRGRARGRGRGQYREQHGNRGGRSHTPGSSSGGRGHRGGHSDYRARPY
jgi:hypothetical protein